MVRKMEKYRSRIEDICKKIASELHLALYDIEEKVTAKGTVIVVFVTKLGGINLDECAAFSRRLSEELDVLDFISDHYFLEVSSPGIERPLRLKSHYISAINELVEIIWDVDNKRISTQGILQEVNPDDIIILEAEELVKIPISAIHKAHTCFSTSKKREQI
jgi:ribosome maturation factor RimP